MDDPPSGDETASRLSRGLLIGCCVLAVIAASLVVPAFAADGIAGSPLERVLPGDIGGGSTGDLGNDGGGLGALNPGASTGVGGEVGLDSETFGSTDTERHFVVESNEPAYWRTAAYDRYTGSGWEQTGETESYDGNIEHPGVDGDRVEYELTLQQTAAALPTAFRPKLVSGVDDIEVTSEGAVRPKRPVEEGTTIEGVSYLPERDEDLLQAAGSNYPGRIEQRYTRLPEESPDRLETLTDEITADADTPYEQAVAIQNWLRSEKSYNLGASRQSNTIADTFVFEMSSGYCEYFATAMAAMLRTQDIPTRYAIGYTTGQSVGEDTYEVRGMNAHAWVEVYFPDVGWVRFDPTPGGARLAAYEDALAAEGEEPELSEIGSPGEVFQPGEIEGGSDDPENVEGDSGYSTSLNRTAVPGTAVKVTVTRDGDPVVGATVQFNGDTVGTTDGDGTITGTVPDDEALRIAVTDPEDEAASIGDDGITVDDSPSGLREWERNETTLDGPVNEGPDETDETARSVATGVVGGGGTVAAAGVPAVQEDNETSVNGGVHPIERTATVELTGDIRAGEALTVLVRAGDLRLDGATVSVDGEAVATTDAEGEATVALPDEPGQVTIAAERGPVTGERTIAIPELSVDIDTGAGLALPGRTVTVTAELDGEPAEGAIVEVNGAEVARTNGNGTATVTLPAEPGATIAVSAAGQTSETTIGGLLVNAALVASVLLAGVGGLAYAGYTRRGQFTHGLGSLVRLPSRLRTGVVGLLVGVATEVDRSQPTAADSTARGPSLPTLGVIRQRARALVAGLRGTANQSDDGTAAPEPNQVTIREGWDRFLGRLSVSDPGTRTPGELAAHAIEEEDLPEPAVSTLRDAFRAVEYGARSPADRLERVQRALEQIEQSDAGHRTDGGTVEEEAASE